MAILCIQQMASINMHCIGGLLSPDTRGQTVPGTTVWTGDSMYSKLQLIGQCMLPAIQPDQTRDTFQGIREWAVPSRDVCVIIFDRALSQLWLTLGSNTWVTDCRNILKYVDEDNNCWNNKRTLLSSSSSYSFNVRDPKTHTVFQASALARVGHDYWSPKIWSKIDRSQPACIMIIFSVCVIIFIISTCPVYAVLELLDRGQTHHFSIWHLPFLLQLVQGITCIHLTPPPPPRMPSINKRWSSISIIFKQTLSTWLSIGTKLYHCFNFV